MQPHPDQVKAGQIVAGCLKLARKLCEDPICASELDRQIEEYIQAGGGAPALKGYQPPFTDLTYQHALCLSLNNEAVHGPPVARQVLPDDLISVDLVVKVGDWHADAARTFTYSENKKVKTFVTKSHIIFKTATDSITKNLPMNNLGRSIDTYAEGLGLEVISEFCGHGIGRSIHEEPQIHNHDSLSFSKFEVGRSYAVEPVLANGPYSLQHHEDGWTVSANCLTSHFEDTFFIGDECIIRLTEEF